MEIDLKTKIQYQLDILGYINISDKRYSRFCVVTDLNVNYSPRISLYALANGNTIPVKISKQIYKKHPLKRGDIVKVIDQYRKPKSKKVNGEWIQTDEKEWWVTDYKVY